MKSEIKDKIKEQVKRLLLSVKLPLDNPLEGEEEIIVFIDKYNTYIKNNYLRQSFFNGIDYDDYIKIFRQILNEEVNVRLFERLKKLFFNEITFSSIISDNSDSKISVIQNQFYNLYSGLINNPVFRYRLTGILRVLRCGIVDRYCRKIVEDISYIDLELINKERIHFSPEMLSEYIKILLVISPLVDAENGTQFLKRDQIYETALKFENNINHVVADNVYDFIKQKVKGLGKNLINKAVMINSRIIYNIDGVSCDIRLARIFLVLGRFLINTNNSDRGALTPEGSVIKTLAKSSDSYGVDKEMMNELAAISLRYGW